MKSIQRISLLVVLLAVSTAYSQSGAIYLQQVNNYHSGYIPTWLEANVPVRLGIGVTNNTGGTALQIKGIFEVYSTDGATWEPIVVSWSDVLNWNTLFDGGLFPGTIGADGQGADTALFNCFSIFGPGLQNGVSAIAWIIETTLDSNQIGKHFCIDSVMQIPGGPGWLWTTTVGGVQPTWSGEHCFTIEADCCQDVRGDVNGDGINSNILDLTFLIDKIFRSGPNPPCPLEADLNGDGVSGNIQDLTYLIDYKWRGGPEGVACP
jgi:hypothetical protein